MCLLFLRLEKPSLHLYETSSEQDLYPDLVLLLPLTEKGRLKVTDLV